MEQKKVEPECRCHPMCKYPFQESGYCRQRYNEPPRVEPEKTDVLFCMDCGLPYEIFGMDAVMPRAQWLEINPDDGGLLCANCMVKRASKVKGATCIHFIIEVFSK